MAFLTLNDKVIPVSSIVEMNEEIGSRGRAYSGAYLLGTRAHKRKWKCVCKPQSQADAQLIRDILQGRNIHHWPLVSDLYTSKGVPPTASQGFYAEAVTAADGAAVSWVDPGNSTPAKFGEASSI
jgi:hypothetical protein